MSVMVVGPICHGTSMAYEGLELFPVANEKIAGAEKVKRRAQYLQKEPSPKSWTPGHRHHRGKKTIASDVIAEESLDLVQDEITSLVCYVIKASHGRPPWPEGDMQGNA